MATKPLTQDETNVIDAVAILENLSNCSQLTRILKKISPLDHQAVFETMMWTRVDEPLPVLQYFVLNTDVFENKAPLLLETLKKRVSTQSIYFSNDNMTDFTPVWKKAISELALLKPIHPSHQSYTNHVSSLLKMVAERTQPKDWNSIFAQLFTDMATVSPSFTKKLSKTVISRWNKALTKHTVLPQDIKQQTNETLKAIKEATKKEKLNREKEILRTEIVRSVHNNYTSPPKNLNLFKQFTKQEKFQTTFSVLKHSTTMVDNLKKLNELVGEELGNSFITTAAILGRLVMNPDTQAKQRKSLLDALTLRQKQNIRTALAFMSPINAQVTKNIEAVTKYLDTHKVGLLAFPASIPEYLESDMDLNILFSKGGCRHVLKNITALSKEHIIPPTILGLLEGFCHVHDIPYGLSSQKSFPKMAPPTSAYRGETHQKLVKKYNDLASKKNLKQKIKKSLGKTISLEEKRSVPKRKM